MSLKENGYMVTLFYIILFHLALAISLDLINYQELPSHEGIGKRILDPSMVCLLVGEKFFFPTNM